MSFCEFVLLSFCLFRARTPESLLLYIIIFFIIIYYIYNNKSSQSVSHSVESHKRTKGQKDTRAERRKGVLPAASWCGYAAARGGWHGSALQGWHGSARRGCGLHGAGVGRCFFCKKGGFAGWKRGKGYGLRCFFCKNKNILKFFPRISCTEEIFSVTLHREKKKRMSNPLKKKGENDYVWKNSLSQSEAEVGLPG